MRTWTRNVLKRACGRCGHPIEVGDPIVRITFTQSQVKLWRCDQCEGPAPADLPPLAPPPLERPALMTRIRQLLAATSHDWKRSQGNDQ